MGIIDIGLESRWIQPMTFISRIRLAESLNDRADARLRSTVQRWPGRKTREILSDLFLNSIALAIRQLPGMATFSPMMLSIVIGIAFHTIVGTAMGLETNIGRLTAKGFRPFLLGAFAFLLVAGFRLTLIELMG
jgi:uncharacterized membrane protein YadS